MKPKKLLLYAYIVLLFFVVFLMAMLWNVIRHKDKPLEIRDYPQIVASGTLNIVTDCNSIGYFVSGFRYEMIRALEKEWGVQVRVFIENGLNDNLNGLLSQHYDLVARPIPVNSVLRDLFSFTQPIVLNKQVLVQRKSAYNNDIEPVRQHLDLARKTIHVPNNSPAILRLANLAHEIGDTIYIAENEAYETEQLVMLVALGDIDFTVSDKRTARRLTAIFPQIDIETDISFTQIEAWAVRKDSPILLDSLNAWLTRFRVMEGFEGI